MELEPSLTTFGYGVSYDRKQTDAERRVRFAENRASLLDDYYVDRFLRAASFLSQFGRRKTINRKSSSYGLKHEAEKLAGGYVAIGTFIDAALALGFSAQPTDPESPNAWFNISFRARVPAVGLAEAA